MPRGQAPNKFKGQTGNMNIYVVGDNRVGKTSLINKYAKDEFSKEYKKTKYEEVEGKHWPKHPVDHVRDIRMTFRSRDGKDTEQKFQKGEAAFMICTASACLFG